jgi:hypothetical protein
MPRAGLEPAIPATKRPQTYALDPAATRIGNEPHYNHFMHYKADRCRLATRQEVDKQ